MDTKTITAQTKKAVAIGVCASLIGGVAAPVLSTANVAHAAVASKPQPNTTHSSFIRFKDPALKELILDAMKKQKLIAPDATEINEADALKIHDLLDLDNFGDKITSLGGIEKFKNITRLWLRNNQISDLTPLAGLTNLTTLDLGYNRIVDIKPLAGLTNLTSLDLDNNYHISDLKPIAGLTNLTQLWFENTEISDITPLAGLTNLTRLYLSGNQISDITPLATLTKLNSFDATEQKINLKPTTTIVDLKKEIRGFGNVTFAPDEDIVNGVLTYKKGMNSLYQIEANEKNVKYKYSATIDVDFSNTKSPIIQFKDQALKERILSEMKGQKIIALDAHDITETDALKVENLNLSINKYLGDTSLSLENIDKFKNLKSLDLTGNKLPSIKPLIKLPQLSKLYLAERSFGADFYRQRGCLYNEDTLLSLKLLPALKELTVRTNTIKPLAGLTNLTSLFIRGNQITDLTPLKGLTNLTTLAVPNNQISDLKPLAGLTNLTFVNLANNQITDLTPLKGLTNLTTLYLNHNKITDIKPLAGLTNLTELRLSGCYDVTFDFPNSISDISPLHDLKKLKLLNLKDNQITDITPLAGLSNLTELTLSCNQIVDFSLLKNKNIKNLSTGPQVFVIKAATRDIVVNKEVSTNGRVGELIDFGSSYATFNPTTNKLALKEIPKETTLQGESKYHLIRYKSIKDEFSSIFMPNYAFYVDFTPYINSLKERVKASGAPEEEQQKIIEKMNSGTLTVEQFEKDIAELTRKAKFHDQTIQTEDMSAALAALLKDADNIKACANYNNADDNLKQAYDTAITDGKKVYDKLSSTPEQVKQATEQIKTTLGALNGDKKAQAIKEQLSTATQQISSLQSELEKAKEQGTTNKSKIEQLNRQISTLNGQLEKLKSDKTLSEQQKQAEIDELNGKIAVLGKQITQLTQENTTLKGQVASLQEQLEKLQGQLQSAQQQGVADKATIERLTGQVTTLSSQLEALKADKTKSDQEKQKEIERLTAQLRDLTSQVNVLTNEKRTLQQQLDAATGKVSALTSELEQLKAAKKQADEQNQQTIAGLNSQITQLAKDKQGLQDQINTKQAEISKLQGQIQALKDDHSKSDTEKQQEIERLTNQFAALTQEKQDLQGKLAAANEKISTLTHQLQQAASKTDADTKQLQELTNALQQTKQQLEQLKSDKTKSDEQKQKEIDTLNAKIAELEKKVQTCSAQAVGGALVAPLVNEKPTFDIEKYKREHNYALPGIATHTYQTTPDTFTSDVHAALQQLAPMAASTDAAAQATAQRTDESERAQAEQKADTSSKQEADKTKLDQNKFPQTGDNSLLTLLSTFAGALVLVLGCFARKKSSKANKR